MIKIPKFGDPNINLTVDYVQEGLVWRPKEYEKKNSTVFVRPVSDLFPSSKTKQISPKWSVVEQTKN